MVHLVQIVHQSCNDTNTTSKRTETRFHMSHVTYKFHWVCPKWFLSLWYARHQPCPYLASRLTLSSNELNRASTWASSPRSTTGGIQNDFWAYCMFSKKLCTYLALTLTLSPNGPKQDSSRPTSPSCSIHFLQNFMRLWYVRCKPCAYLASRLGLSPSELSQASTWASSPRSMIECP
jgi:hypothetical protein